MEETSQRLKVEEQRLQREIHRLEAEKSRLTQEQYEEEEPPPKKKIGRNDPCPCGSGKKFKKCCMRKRQGDGDLFE